MQAQANKAALILVLVVLGAVLLLLIQPQNTGLAALTVGEQDKTAEETQSLTVEKAVEQPQEQIKAEISFSIVKDTELKVELLKGRLKPCPHYSELAFMVENIGKVQAERLFVEYPPNLKVSSCINCSQKHINPKQRVKVIMRACESEENQISVFFSSVNAEKKAVQVE